MIRWIVYLCMSAALWPVYALLLLRRATPRTQYRQIGKAAGIALLWPLMLVVTVGGVVVMRSASALRKRSRPAPPVAVSTTD